MARLAVIVDRPPHDPEWKGSVAWNIIRSLAESQHEVLALTTCDLAEIDVDHPRLNVARPAPSFGLRHLAKWLRAVLQFQPQVVHTFALRASGPRALTVWPMLESALSVMPRVKRFSTALSESDLLPFRNVEAPFELPAVAAPIAAEFGAKPATSTAILVPAPVSEWHRWQESVLLLNEFLLSNREVNIEIIGGWGDLPLTDRRAGWRMLENVTQQVHMKEPMRFDHFVEAARNSGGIWLRALQPNSWRALSAAHVARSFSLTTWGDVPEVKLGSAANFLSRLYSQ